MAFKTFKSDKLRDTNSSCLLCAGLAMAPVRYRHQLPLSQPAWLLQPHHKYLLQFSTGRSSNPTFFQVPPFKTNQNYHYSSSSNPGTGSAPQYQSIPMASSCSWHRSLPNTFDAVTPFPDPFATSLPAPHFSLTLLSSFSHEWKTSSRTEISVHLVNLKSSRVSDFQNKSQWMLK